MSARIEPIHNLSSLWEGSFFLHNKPYCDSLCYILGLAMSQIELEKIADHFDCDQDGYIDLSEVSYMYFCCNILIEIKLFLSL